MAASPMDLFAGVIPFVATAEAKSFRVAAKQLGVSAPVVSKAIAKLESDLGVRLLHRSARSVTLTSEGEAFFADCRSATDQVRAARAAVVASRETPHGLLRVSMPAKLGRKVMAALPRLLLGHPRLSLHAILTDRFVKLSDENIDVAVRVGDVDDSRDVVAHRLRSSRWVTAASRAYLDRAGEPRTPADLRDHQALRFLMQSGRPQQWFYRQRGGMVAAKISGHVTADDGEALVAGAVAGLGLVYAPDFMIADELQSGALVEVLRASAAPGPSLSTLCAPGRSRSANVRAFIRLMREVLGG